MGVDTTQHSLSPELARPLVGEGIVVAEGSTVAEVEACRNPEVEEGAAKLQDFRPSLSALRNWGKTRHCQTAVCRNSDRTRIAHELMHFYLGVLSRRTRPLAVALEEWCGVEADSDPQQAFPRQSRIST